MIYSELLFNSRILFFLSFLSHVEFDSVLWLEPRVQNTEALCSVPPFLTMNPNALPQNVLHCHLRRGQWCLGSGPLGLALE